VFFLHKCIFVFEDDLDAGKGSLFGEKADLEILRREIFLRRT
jgi:hypothetical protein